VTYDAVVIGAGVVGAACAYALAGDGHRVLVVEQGTAATGATATAMGHVVVLDDTPAQFALTRYGRDLWDACAPQLPAASADNVCGTLWLATDAEELSALRARSARYTVQGVHAEILDERSLADAEPELRAGLAGAMYVRGDHVLAPVPTTQWLLEQGKALGVVIRERCGVLAVSDRTVTLSDARVPAGVIVLAAGVRSPALVPELPLVPRKGQLVAARGWGTRVRHELVEVGYLHSAHTLTAVSLAFNVQPRRSGDLLIGASRELAGWDSAVDPAVIAQLVGRATSFLPRLGAATFGEPWAGFRPATPDKLPLIGRWDAIDGLWIATGHEGLGVTTALATAQLVADAVAGRAGAIDPTPYAPGRVLAPTYPRWHEVVA
jgi:glycine/D-amino acid oxidase-like deaminating enzyme